MAAGSLGPLLRHLPAELKDFSEHAAAFLEHCGRRLCNPVNMAPEQFSHRPSLALGVGVVAGTIERAQCAEVRIFDLKLGVTQAEVLAAYGTNVLM